MRRSIFHKKGWNVIWVDLNKSGDGFPSIGLFIYPACESIINEESLIEALQAKRLAKAALEVYS